MLNILIASHNQSKIKRYKKLFSEINSLKITTLMELGIDFKVDEPFNSSSENAEHKAMEYGRISKLPTIAIDEAVKTNFLPENEQPGVFVRRFKKNIEQSDIEILNIWKKIFDLYPQNNLEFTWEFSMSYYNPHNNYLKTLQTTQINKVSKKFSSIIDPGYPMSSFLIPNGFNRPHSELSEVERLMVDKINLDQFLKFVRNLIKYESSNIKK